MAQDYKFYDKIAKKFGNYYTPHKNVAEYAGENPEEFFKSKLLECGSNKTALDLGCADGMFTLSIAHFFIKIVAIDLSKKMLAAAQKLQKEKKIENVSFEIEDASHTTYQDNSFDVVYSRRGPTPYEEIKRLLKPNGFFVGILIGELDCMEIKNVFGRGQDYGLHKISTKALDVKKLKKLGFKILSTKDYFYNEFYPTYNDLDIFLQGVPIFEDFDSKKDRGKLSEYIRKNTAKKGIKLPRHRVVIIAQISK